MAKAQRDFTDILVKKGIISPDQLEEARGLANSTGIKVQEAISKLNYASSEELMGAIAEFHNLDFVSLLEVTVPQSVIEMVPESVARENRIIPLSAEGNIIKIATNEPDNYDVLQKLQFILNKDIAPVLADREQIVAAINRHYGQTETESVDSMIAEFTDTQIDFTETEATAANALSTDESDAPELMRVVIDQIGNATDTLTEAEVNRAKAQMKAGLLMALESSEARVAQIARQMLAYGRPISLEEISSTLSAPWKAATRVSGRS